MRWYSSLIPSYVLCNEKRMSSLRQLPFTNMSLPCGVCTFWGCIGLVLWTGGINHVRKWVVEERRTQETSCFFNLLISVEMEELHLNWLIFCGKLRSVILTAHHKIELRSFARQEPS